MVIQRYGSYFTKISVGDQVIGINSPSKESTFKQSKFGAQIALQSMNHPDFDGLDQLEGNKNNTNYSIKGPGEYEINEIFVNGFVSRAKYDGVDEQINTIYSILFDGINIVYLGPLQNTDIDEKTAEDLYMADIIFIPIGSDNVLSADDAFKFIKKFSPKIVIPIGYDEKKNKSDLETFVSNFGEKMSSDEKLTIKKKDMEAESMDVVVLTEAK